MTAPPMPAPTIDAQGYDETMRDLFGPEAQAGAADGMENESRANEIAAPNEPEDQDMIEPVEQLRRLMAALYGSAFPLIAALDKVIGLDPMIETLGIIPATEVLLKHTTADEWVSWTKSRWASHLGAVEMHLYLVARNRLMRSGQQWVSSKGREAWREPARPSESARVVHNMIGPALDQRIQIITDQKPGFEVDPTSISPNEKRKASGRQQALEFQYDEQKMARQTHEAAYWAGTDGCAFWHTYWDRDAGPWDKRMGNVPDQRKPLGDLRTRTLRVEQVRVSSNATSTEAPYYVILRDVLSETEAAYIYGAAGIQGRSNSEGSAAGDNDSSGSNSDGLMPNWVLSQTVVGEGNRLNNVQTTERFTMYIDRHPDVLPDGLQLVVIGDAVAWGPGELLFGVIPVVRVTDGSSDPSYLPRPIMEQWIPPQMRINAALSLWVNSVRVNSGGRFIARPDAVSRETFIGSGLSILEVEGQGDLHNQVLPINGFLVGQDVKDLIAFDVKALEDMSGFNDVSRGQISTETATAVAIANEQLQRVFAPAVGAIAQAAMDWAEVNLAGMAWGYDIPRNVGAVGSDRPDLARALSAEDFDGPSTVRVEASKLLPMPKVYRLQILDSRLERGLISPQQYMRNVEFAGVKHMSSPDEDQESRARRIADALRMKVPPEQVPPIRWQDNESIHQDVLDREILLQDDLPQEVIQAADMRWKQLAAQAAMKAGMMQPPMMQGTEEPAQPPGGAGGSTPLPPVTGSPDQLAPPAPMGAI